ncbi:uncharacterized protein [Argopecten irradians]|uniref:uncharacterized protein n=1 Tax=Argopecten irradians TaxID=31199 RepID=UPI00371B9EC9
MSEQEVGDNVKPKTQEQPPQTRERDTGSEIPTPERQPRVRTLTEKAFELYQKTVQNHQALLRDSWQEVCEVINEVTIVKDNRKDIGDAKTKLCLVYSRYRLRARDYVDYMHANYTEDSIRYLDSFTREDAQSDDMVKSVLHQLDEKGDSLCDRSSRHSSSSRRSDASSEARRKKALASKAKASKEFLQKQAQIRRKQAELEEQEAMTQARTQRLKQELNVDLDLVKNEQLCAEAEAEAEAYEEMALEENGQILPDEVESSYERTKVFVNDHSGIPQEDVALRPTARAFIPQTQSAANTRPSDESPPLRDHKDEVMPTIVNFLMRKELASSRLFVFNDKPNNYISWRTTFKAVVQEASLGAAEELDLLVKWLGPTSSTYALSIRSSNGSNPELGKRLLWERLDERFGSPEAVEACLRSKLDNFPKTIDNVRMYELADVLTEILVLKEDPRYQQILAHYDSPLGIRQVLNKLPTRLQFKWNDRAFSYKNTRNVSFPPFSYFVTFIKDMARLLNDPSFSIEGQKSTSGEVRNPKKTDNRSITVKKTEVTSKEKELDTKMCPLHNSRTHFLNECRDFGRRPIEERKNLLKEHKICFKCCTTDKHIAKDCKVQLSCSVCGRKRHLTVLHERRDSDHTRNKENLTNPRNQVEKHNQVETHQSSENQKVNTHCTLVCGDGFHGRSCSNIVLVEVFSEDEPSKRVSTYALLDDQSNRSLASTELLDSLGMAGREIEYTLTSCSGRSKLTGRKAIGLVIRSSEGSTMYSLPPLIECNNIPTDESEIPTPEVVRHFSHLKQLGSRIPEYKPDCSVGLLVGRDLPEAHHINQQITGPRGSPFAQRTGLGWVIVGEVCLNKAHPPDRDIRVSTFKTNIVNGHASILAPCKNYLWVKEEIRYDPLFERGKDDEKPAWSVEDREFMEIMSNQCVQDEDGFWVAPLPFRTGRTKLPNNKSVAIKRAMILDRSLKTDKDKRDHFVAFMKKVLDSGAAEVAPPPQGEVWYLPFFGVYNSKKPGRIRGVFDSSAEFKGTSLNQNLLSGPNLTNSLLSILLRFRKDKYAVSADIEQMFYRFLVKEEHRNFLRFFWYRNNDPNLDLIEYRMLAHVFGNSPSPAVATFALHKAVEKADGDIRNFVMNDFYVDDALTSGPDASRVTALLKRTQSVLQNNGNIRLHKVVSNSMEIVKAFPQEDLSEGLASIDIKADKMPTQSSLGVSWNLDSDTFHFDVQLPVQSETRREMLSTLNSIFDPMGILSPFSIQGRILLRELTTGVSWDTPLPISYQNKWNAWKASLTSLKDIQIPRMFTPISTSIADDVQLHVYCDASELATIPRLELCAAVLAVEVGEVACETLGVENVRYHSDSRVVLGYINNRTRRFYTYVANRVERILRSSRPSQWIYVSTCDNPADQATRSSATLKGFEKSLWLQGPKQLPKNHDSTYDLVEPDNDKELRPTVTSLKTVCQKTPCTRFEHFSSWRRLANAVLLIKRAVQRFRNRWRGNTEDDQPFLPNRGDAEVAAIRLVQQSTFSEEIGCLEKDKPVPERSPIKTLDPYLDNKGILRVGGRLRNSCLPFEETNPIILPKKHHVSKLIVRFYHEFVHHQGRLITEGSLRNNGYWIIGAKRLISSIIRDCVTCRKLRGKLEHQKMAALPADRLVPGPPFTSVGVDVFGPWSIVTRKTRGGSANSKRWAVLFTCLTTRAIHIEVVEEMTSSSFINALRCFVAFRGNVKEFRSDCGTNFIGAVNELGITGIHVGDAPVAKYLSDSDIVWKFNAPHSSHMGGVWERMIGLVRRILEGMMLDGSLKRLTHEVLTTFMAEVCAIVNSRPIASISTDPKCPEILSPATLLNQKIGYADHVSTLTFSEKDMYKSHWRQVQALSDIFWRKWREGYIQNLQSRKKWKSDRPEVKEGDIILLREKTVPRSDWRMGIVTRAFRSDLDNKVRKAEVRIGKDGSTTLLTRPINELVLLLEN